MGIFRKSKEELLAQAETKAAQARNSHTGSPCPAADHNISVTKLLRCAEGGWLRPQAEKAIINAAKEGDLATLKRLVEELESASLPTRTRLAPLLLCDRMR